ncbi:MAG: hypothetical protein ACRDAP_19690, partial [Shewanella sp.]
MQPTTFASPSTSSAIQDPPDDNGPPAQGLNIVAVHNATGVNPALLGAWVMDTPSPAAQRATITMHLQRQTPLLQVTANNQNAVNLAVQSIQPNLRPLPVGAEALTTDFTIEQPSPQPQQYTYQVNGFGKDDRLAIDPLSPAEKERLQHDTTPEVSRCILDATIALTDTDVILTTSPTEQILTAEYGETRVKFRRNIDAVPPLELQPATRQQEAAPSAQGAVGGLGGEVLRQYNDKLKDSLFTLMQGGASNFEPDNTEDNKLKLMGQWTLCYYGGEELSSDCMEAKLTIKRDHLKAKGKLYADFSQNGFSCEGWELLVNANQISFIDNGMASSSEDNLQALLGNEQSLIQMLGAGMEILYLDCTK